MQSAMLMTRKKNKVIVDPGNILLLSHMDSEPPVNLATGLPFTKTGTGTYVNSGSSKFGAGSIRAARTTIGDYKFTMAERLDPAVWTIEGWVNFGNEGGSGTGRGAQHFTLGYNPSNGGFGLQLKFDTTSFRIFIRASSTGSNTAFNTTAAPGKSFANVWEHFALVRDNTVMRAYIGGILVLTQNYPPRPDDRSLNNMLGYTGSFDSCSFDEWRITNRQALYNNNFTPPNRAFTELDV